MTSWRDLETELNRWEQAGKSVQLWWRDDDAAHDSAALETLCTLAQKTKSPLALAVIPKTFNHNLLNRTRENPTISLLQHGYSHINYGLGQGKKAELGPHRNSNIILNDLRSGFQILRSRPGFLPVLVPPWNRIDEDLIPRLSEIGFKGLSTYNARRAPSPAPGLSQVNTHVDLIDWANDKRFLGTEAVLNLCREHLTAKREGRGDAREATGILTHHLVHDQDTWAFLEEFLNRTRRNRAVKWCCAKDVFRL